MIYRCCRLTGLMLLALAFTTLSSTSLSETKSAKAADSEKSKTIKDITFDTIKLDLKKDQPFERDVHLTDQVEKLDKTRVRIRGWILPGFQQRGITQFVLVRDNKECCFGPGAALYDCILVEMETGKSTEFTTRPVAVEGTFTLSEFKGPDGKQLAIYHLSGESVK